jgi:hypothetical protein
MNESNFYKLTLFTFFIAFTIMGCKNKEIYQSLICHLKNKIFFLFLLMILDQKSVHMEKQK